MNLESNAETYDWGSPKIVLEKEWIRENKLFLLLKNHDHTLSLFLGEPYKNKNKFISNLVSEMEFYHYQENSLFYIDLEDETKRGPQPYIGEKIDFKAIDVFDEGLVKDLFSALAKGLKINKWFNLSKALSDISDWLSSATKKEIDNRLKGYLGEMALVWSIMNNPNIPNNSELATLVFDSYQRTINEKHDFLISPQLRLEVKSTSHDSASFKIRMSQKLDLPNIKIFYAFVKYNLVQESLGKNLESLLSEIKNGLGLEEARFPNHLFIQASKKENNNFHIDPKNIEIYIFDSSQLPSFGNNHLENGVTDIQYRLNLYSFLKTLPQAYNERTAFKNLYLFTKGMSLDESTNGSATTINRSHSG